MVDYECADRYTPELDALSYDWQELIADAFTSAPESLQIKLNLAAIIIAARLQSYETDDRERIALKSMQNALRVMIHPSTGLEMRL